MKNLICWSLAVALVLAGCGDRNSTKHSDAVGRSLASVDSINPANVPVSAVKFFLNQKQNVKVDQAIKTYSSILPADIYARLQKLSLQVDDAGFTVTRNGNMMILKNEGHELKVKIVGTAQNLMLNFEGKTYDFSKASTLSDLVATLESNVNGSGKTALVLPFLKSCPLIPLMLPQSAQAADWFFLGGMAVLAIGIAFAAYYMGKSVKNTKHTVKGEVGLDESSKKALDDISKRLENIEVNVNGNVTTDHNINLGVSTDKDAKSVE